MIARRNRFIVITAVACLTGYVYVYASGRQQTPVRSDAFSYYVYLPSWLLYHDASLQPVADDCCGGAFPEWTAINRAPSTGWWVDSHPIGEAILTAPFFAAAHALTRWSNLSRAGFSLYDVHAAGIAGLCYVLIGLWFLHRLLCRNFESTTDVVLAVLLTGTSLFHYATYDSAWSHAFSFALCAALLERLDAWKAGPPIDAVTIGAISGLIVLVRHTNVVVPLCFVPATAFRRDVSRTAGAHLVVAACATALLVVAPQLMLYHAATGHWLVNPYGERGFTFTSPHLFGVLFSAQKGVFFYAPVLLVAVAGLFCLPPRLRHWRWPALIAFAVVAWTAASWWDWQYGASFGHRAFVDLYPIFAIGLGAAFERIAARPRTIAIAATAMVILCALSMFQMLQYWHGVLPASDLTWHGYRDVFLKPW